MMFLLADFKTQAINSGLIFMMVFTIGMLGTRPLLIHMRRKEAEYDEVLNRVLLLGIPPKVIFIMTFFSVLLCGFIGFGLVRGGTRGLVAMMLFGGLGFVLPTVLIRYLRTKRQTKLEEQLVGGIQSLASSVRAGLNLVQAMQMVARDAPNPLRQEVSHMVREYEYGLPLDKSMDNAAIRIGLPNYRLLFSALQTHRERGGDLGETLDDIAESIREIQRLEGRVQTLTAQGRATAKWLGCIPVFVLVGLYLAVPDKTRILFEEVSGNVILGIVFVFNVLSYFWIRKIMDIDL